MTQEEKQKRFNEFKESLKTKSKEELETLEKEIIKEADDTDVKVTNAELKLNKKGFADAGKAIQYFLNQQKVQWNYTQGLVSMYEFWDEYHDTVKFPMLDSTLRMLGQLQFTGYDEWKKVICINEYFENVREEYRELSDSIFYVADRHNAVMEQLDLHKPVSETENS